jgi:hypothetical protein
MDKKINSLVDMGYPEDEANLAITRCGMPLFESLTDDHAFLETLCCIFLLKIF